MGRVDLEGFDLSEAEVGLSEGGGCRLLGEFGG